MLHLRTIFNPNNTSKNNRLYLVDILESSESPAMISPFCGQEIQHITQTHYYL